MLYIILIGVIIFLFLKMNKSKPISEAKLTEKIVKQLEEKMRLNNVVSEQPKQVKVEKQEVIIEAKEELHEEVENIILDEALLDTETEEPELKAEDEKKPLSEIIKKRIHHRKVLTLNEQPMFHRLKEALPEYSVLPQVSFNSLVWSRSKYIRNRFNRKVCDFAICDEVFKPIAVVELDDASHNGREQEDADRDCILNEAKIRVIRYKQTPEIEVIRKDFGLEPFVK